MVATLLTSKHQVPARRAGAVPRPRLAWQLQAASRGALTLLAAPAGFGKTTCLTEWLATLPPGDPAVAWLSLDAGDSDPALFWAYLLAAIRTTVPGVGSEASQLLASSPPAVDAALAALINDLGGLTTDLLLVLDDYHLVDGPGVHRQVAFLLEHQPSRLHLLLATRTDPPLPLARMRARGSSARSARRTSASPSRSRPLT